MGDTILKGLSEVVRALQSFLVYLDIDSRRNDGISCVFSVILSRCCPILARQLLFRSSKLVSDLRGSEWQQNRGYRPQDRNYPQQDRDHRQQDRNHPQQDRDYRQQDRDYRRQDRDYRQQDRDYQQQDRDYRQQSGYPGDRGGFGDRRDDSRQRLAIISSVTQRRVVQNKVVSRE